MPDMAKLPTTDQELLDLGVRIRGIRDFGEKLPCYKQIPSLQHILYLETENVKAFHFQRREDGRWLEGIYTDKNDRIALPYGAIALGELYVE